MRQYVPFILAFGLALTGCDQKDEEDPSEIERMVLVEEDEEDTSLIPAAESTSVANEELPIPNELINQEEPNQAR